MTDTVTVPLSQIFDGQMWMFVPGVDFSWPCDQEVVDWEELDEDEPLDDYETPACIAVLSTNRGATSGTAKWPEADQIKHAIGQGWSSFSVGMSALMHIVGGDKDQYQYPKYDGTPDLFSFQLVLDKTEGSWQGGIL